MVRRYILIIPGLLSSIVMKDELGEPITTADGWLVDVITTLKYSGSSVMRSSKVYTIMVAYISPALKLTVDGPVT